MTTLILLPYKWEKLRNKLIEDYGPKIFIGFISKKKLGCSFRTHYKTAEWGVFDAEYDVRIDFYNEAKQTWFLMKYSEFL